MSNASPAPPVAFRLKRPYATEDEFVAGEGHTVFRSGMVLVGAAPRPSGVIVRFEVALRDGTSLIRGEGRVVAFRQAPEGPKPAGLEVKFSRLDPRGKAVVERVLRERHPPSSGSIPDLGLSPSIAPAPLSMPPSSGPIAPVIPSLEPPPSLEAPPSYEPTVVTAPVEVLPEPEPLLPPSLPPPSLPPPALADEATQASLPPVASALDTREPPPEAPSTEGEVASSEGLEGDAGEAGETTEQAPPARALDALAAAPALPSSPPPAALAAAASPVVPADGSALARLRGREAAVKMPEGASREALLERLRARPPSRA